ncbi:MAG: hypothetical protein EXS04_05990 [Phycisphaerales bacterium]|nr:hypothetical protein [Phycisphaerales bacterium]PHX78230.1 MAG: hypothetical protein CK544_03895 [Planctomycetaceae bacterium]
MKVCPRTITLRASTGITALAVEPAVTGLIPLVALGVLGIGTPAEIAAPFANDVIFLFGGGGACETTELMSRLHPVSSRARAPLTEQ